MMKTSYLSVLPRFFVAAVLALFITGCEIFTPREPKPGPEPQSCSSSNNALELVEASFYEQELACLVINHEEQQRTEMHYHPILGEIARMRAQDMALNGPYGGGREYPPHVDHDGYGPNHYLCEAGYRKEVYCSDNPYSNSVESIAFGESTPIVVMLSWYESDGHRRHLLGESEFFANSNYYGIGHASGTEGQPGAIRRSDFWVFIAAFPPIAGSELH